jgi:hypothetical protein
MMFRIAGKTSFRTRRIIKAKQHHRDGDWRSPDGHGRIATISAGGVQPPPFCVSQRRYGKDGVGMNATDTSDRRI